MKTDEGLEFHFIQPTSLIARIHPNTPHWGLEGDWSEIKVGKDFSLTLGSARINGGVADAQKIKISHTL